MLLEFSLALSATPDIGDEKGEGTCDDISSLLLAKGDGREG
jgi:hypothetical protein